MNPWAKEAIPTPPSAPPPHILKGSPYMFWLTTLAVFVLQCQHLVLAFSLQLELITSTAFLVPICWVLVIIAILSDPRRRDRKYRIMLRVLFLSYALVGEVLYSIISARLYWIKSGSLWWFLGYVVRFGFECVLFYQLLKMRAKVGRMDDADVSDFLTKSLYGGGFKGEGGGEGRLGGGCFGAITN